MAPADAGDGVQITCSTFLQLMGSKEIHDVDSNGKALVLLLSWKLHEKPLELNALSHLGENHMV